MLAVSSNISIRQDQIETVLASQGNWIVRVEACNHHGCSGPATSSTDVIINIPGHHAVRVWHTDEGLEIDWDELPGKYLVEYRLSTDSTRWKQSDILDSPGHTIAHDNFYDFEGTGHPIVRVYFGCNDDGEGCGHLGRWPNNSLQELSRFTGPPPPTKPNGHSTRSANGEIADPITGMLRPRSDFTVTTERIHGEDGAYTCVARPAENRLGDPDLRRDRQEMLQTRGDHRRPLRPGPIRDLRGRRHLRHTQTRK